MFDLRGLAEVRQGSYCRYTAIPFISSPNSEEKTKGKNTKGSALDTGQTNLILKIFGFIPKKVGPSIIPLGRKALAAQPHQEQLYLRCRKSGTTADGRT